MAVGIRIRWALLVVVALFVSACEATPPTVAPADTVLGLRIEFADSSVSVPPSGGPRTVQVLVTRESYDGPYELSATAPLGVELQPITVPTGAGSATTQLQFEIDETLPAGEYPIVVTASAGDSAWVRATLAAQLHPVDGSIRDSLLPVSRGLKNVTTVDLTIAAGAEVSLTATDLPSWLSVNVTGNGNRRGVEVSAAADAPLVRDTISLVIASGEFELTIPLPVQIREPAPTQPIEFTYCVQHIGSVSAFSYANDGELWTNIAPDADGYFRFDASERFEFRVTSGAGSPSGRPAIFTTIIRGTAAEFAEMQCPPSVGGVHSPNVVAENVGDFNARIGYRRNQRNNGSSSAGGTVIAASVDIIAIGRSASSDERRGIIRRAVDPAASIAPLDFEGPESRALVPWTLTGTGLRTSTGLLTPGAVMMSSGPDVTTSETLWAFDSEDLGPSDLQVVAVQNQEGDARGVVRYFRQPSDLSLELGPSLLAGSKTDDGMTLPVQPEYAGVAGAVFVEVPPLIGPPPSTHTIVVFMTAGYAGGTPTTWEFTPPKIGVFNTAIEPTSSYIALSGSFPTVFGGVAADGTEVRWASRFVDVRVPFPTLR